MGAPMTITSAAMISATNSSDSASAAFCSSLRASAGVKVAPIQVSSMMLGVVSRCSGTNCSSKPPKA
jgi:hypothetical protein